MTRSVSFDDLIECKNGRIVKLGDAKRQDLLEAAEVLRKKAKACERAIQMRERLMRQL
jgi:hypothetical protein